MSTTKLVIVERDKEESSSEEEPLAVEKVEDKKKPKLKRRSVKKRSEEEEDDEGEFENHRSSKKLKRAKPVQSNICKTLFFYAIIGALLIGIGCLAYVLINNHFSSQQPIPIKRFEPTPLSSFHPRQDGCLTVNAGHIRELKEDPHWQQAVKSMVFWMRNNSRIEALTSFHVNNPFCYILLRQFDDSLLGLFNVQFVGYYKNSIISRNEYPLGCDHESRNVDRSNTVMVHYNDEDTGELVLAKFNQTQAWALQSTTFYLMGLSTCKYTDKGIQTLEQIILK